MSARDQLIRILSGGHESQYAAMGPVADQILGVYANELADKVTARAAADPDENWDAVTWKRGMDAAADLIRPKGEEIPNLMGELPGMWEQSDLSGGWADTDGGAR